ncbi:MAG: hypothetical protein JO084_11315 [Bradyrhizobiaceae bacterium]|nr:hypothetical protein [Hyphomicrobiales bacterium]MBV9428305.1 hypothetical protein [Bradyrhizobiaceae bacterium]
MAGSSKLVGLGAMLALSSGVAAQAENLDAGKSPAALFAANCAACHSSPRGLAKDRGNSGLASYLQEHYTSGPQSAAALAAYLIATPGNPRAKQAPVARNPAAPEEGSSKQGEAKTERQTRAPHSTTMRPDSIVEPTEQKRSNAESAKTHGKRQQTKQEPPAAPATSSPEPAAAAAAQPAAPAPAPAAAPVAATPPAPDQSAFSAPSP